MNYFLAPRSGEKKHIGNESTIRHGVSLERIADFLTPEEQETLAKEEVIYAWGNREGTSAAWRKMEIGDTVIFYAHKKLVMTGEVYFKKYSPELGAALWPLDDNGNPWAYTFFVRNLKYISIPIEVFNSIADFDKKAIVQGFKILQQVNIDNIIKSQGSVERMLSNFGDHHSEEEPQETEKLYVNIPRSITPVIHDAPHLTPKNEPSKTTDSKSKAKKVDYIERHKNNSLTGSKGEEIVLDSEKKKLRAANRSDLASMVKRVSIEDDTLGYDILSFNPDGTKKYIEVKTSINSSDKHVRFYVSCNEFNRGKGKGDYYIYFVEKVNSSAPKITVIQDPIDDSRFLIKPDGYVFEAKRN